MNYRQAAYHVNVIQCVDRVWKKKKKRYSLSVLSVSLCIAPNNSKIFKIPSPQEIRSRKVRGTQTTGLSSLCSVWPPTPEIWDPGVVCAASWLSVEKREKKNQGGMLGPKRKLWTYTQSKGFSGSKARVKGCYSQCYWAITNYCCLKPSAQQLHVYIVLCYLRHHKDQAQLPQHSEVLSSVE